MWTNGMYTFHKIYLIYFNNVVHVNILADEVQRLYLNIYSIINFKYRYEAKHV